MLASLLTDLDSSSNSVFGFVHDYDYYANLAYSISPYAFSGLASFYSMLWFLVLVLENYFLVWLGMLLRNDLAGCSYNV